MSARFLHDATVETSGRSEIGVAKFRVSVTSGRDKGRIAESKAGELSIGTDATNGLVLTDKTVSRHHCTIRVVSDAFVLADLGSTNGTRLEGHRVQSAYLEGPANLRVGDTTLTFEPLEDTSTEPLSGHIELEGVIGKSLSMRRIFAVLERVSRSDATILLEGETGTGKGAFARAIHQRSDRRDGPMVVVDSGALPANLVESELFGHEKGAFTGADQSHPGAFERAAGGTLFLDEIGELPLELQPKLLRALEDRVVQRVGGRSTVALDVRVVAATNRDLRAAVNRGTFRADLFYRLDVVRITVPPLRERMEDLPMLIAHFYRSAVQDSRVAPPQALLDRLLRHDWPGNVRELRNAIERAALLGTVDLLDASAVPSERAVTVDDKLSFREAKALATARWEHDFIAGLLARHEGNLSAAARAAKMDRTHLRDLARRYGLRDAL